MTRRILHNQIVAIEFFQKTLVCLYRKTITMKKMNGWLIFLNLTQVSLNVTTAYLMLPYG